MTMPNESMADELAYVRSLAEEGRNAPLLGGVIYVIWGGIIGSAALIQFAANMGLRFLPEPLTWAPWFAAFVAGWGLSYFFGWRAGGKPGALTIGNKTASAAWFAVGLFMTGFWLTLFFAHGRYLDLGVPAYFLFSLMFPIAFGLYGVAFFATATASRLDWLKLFAFAAWGISFALLFFLNSPYQMLIAAAGSFTCAVVPGILLMRREPAEII